jgi:hypothetical protein
MNVIKVIIYVYGNRIIKSTEIEKGENVKGNKRAIEEVNMAKVHSMHVQKQHNEIPFYS